MFVLIVLLVSLCSQDAVESYNSGSVSSGTGASSSRVSIEVPIIIRNKTHYNFTNNYCNALLCFAGND